MKLINIPHKKQKLYYPILLLMLIQGKLLRLSKGLINGGVCLLMMMVFLIIVISFLEGLL